MLVEAASDAVRLLEEDIGARVERLDAALLAFQRCTAELRARVHEVGRSVSGRLSQSVNQSVCPALDASRQCMNQCIVHMCIQSLNPPMRPSMARCAPSRSRG